MKYLVFVWAYNVISYKVEYMIVTDWVPDIWVVSFLSKCPKNEKKFMKSLLHWRLLQLSFLNTFFGRFRVPIRISDSSPLQKSTIRNNNCLVRHIILSTLSSKYVHESHASSHDGVARVDNFICPKNCSCAQNGISSLD